MIIPFISIEVLKYFMKNIIKILPFIVLFACYNEMSHIDISCHVYFNNTISKLVEHHFSYHCSGKIETLSEWRRIRYFLIFFINFLDAIQFIKIFDYFAETQTIFIFAFF